MILETDSVSKVRYLLMLFRKHPGVEWGADNYLSHPEFHISTTNSLQQFSNVLLKNSVICRFLLKNSVIFLFITEKLRQFTTK